MSDAGRGFAEVDRGAVPAVLGRPHIPALDGMRGLAILLVMLFHMTMVPPVGYVALKWSRATPYGGLGVDIFFVLSGFLITGILLGARGQIHYFRNFYARRALRIFPLYYAITAFSFCVLPRLLPWTVAKFGPVNRDAVWYWLHLSNFSIARRGAFLHGIMDVSWSLAIEEQFYLVWPAVVLLASPRNLRWICLGLICVSCGSRVLLTVLGANPIAVYTLTFCRLDGLATGALVALGSRLLSTSVLRRWAIRALLLSAALFVGIELPSSIRLQAAQDAALTHLMVSTQAGCAILAVIANPQFAPLRFFNFAPLRALGRYSYGLYLFHYPITVLMRDHAMRPGRMPVICGSSLPSLLVFYCVAGGASFSAAFVSWHLYEKQILSFKRFLD